MLPMTTSQNNEKFEAFQPFLKGFGGNCSDEQPPQSPLAIRRKRNVLLLNQCAVLTHFLILTIYSLGIWFAAWKWSVLCRPRELLPLPAREAVHWELRPFTTSLIDNPFAGAPRPELEHTWHNLVSSAWF